MAEKNSSHAQPIPADASSHRQSASNRATLDVRLASLCDLKDDWDTYGGLPPSKAAIARTRQLVEALITALGTRDDAIPPLIAPTSEGGVLLEWTTKPADLEVEVDNEGHLSYLLARHNADGEQYDEHDEATVQEIVDLVSSAIRS